MPKVEAASKAVLGATANWLCWPRADCDPFAVIGAGPASVRNSESVHSRDRDTPSSVRRRVFWFLHSQGDDEQPDHPYRAQHPCHRRDENGRSGFRAPRKCGISRL